MKKALFFLLAFTMIIACKETNKESVPSEKVNESEEIAVNFKSLELDIEGMTCEIGCAKLIESKLSKTEGISYSKVVFESKKGFITYNSNVIKKEEIIDRVAAIAGGDLYSVTNSTEIESVPEVSK